MIKRVEKQTPKYPVWKKWLWSIFALVVMFIAGSFYPNPYTKHVIKVEVETHYTNWANKLGLNEPPFAYNNDVQFVKALNKCIDYINFETPRIQRVPTEMIVAQAALESGWGTSRFAQEGNNLFGIRTWGDHPGMLPLGFPKNNPWRVRIFDTKCDSVKEYVRLLNEHPAYEEFRSMRTKMLIMNEQLDPIKLITTLTKFSTTPDYADRVIRIIKKVRTFEEAIVTDKGVNKVVKEVPKKEKKSNDTLPKKKPEDLNK